MCAQKAARAPNAGGHHPRSAVKRARIIRAAMERFAQEGYEGARVEDVAIEVGIARSSIYQHFGSKAGLFSAAFRQAASALPAWLDVPPTLVEEGFWAILDHWLRRTEHLVNEDWVPDRVVMIGKYSVDLGLKRELTSFLLSEDPYGTLEFVAFGQARGEVRQDVDAEMLASVLDWLVDRFQDAWVAVELDPGLFRRDPSTNRDVRIAQLAELLRGAIGSPRASAEEVDPRMQRGEGLPRADRRGVRR